MLSGVPNASMTVGYTNASWTLRADLVARYVVRLLRHMRDHRLGVAVREVRRGLGQVGEDQVRVRAADRDGNAYEMALAPGDRVRLFASTRAEGEGGSIGRNGSVLTRKMFTDARDVREPEVLRGIETFKK